MRKETARARKADVERPLRLVCIADGRARAQPEKESVQLEPALAVWRLARPSRRNPLPRELARRAISHYTDPGDLVLVPGRRAGGLYEQAARLGRRALPLERAAANARSSRGTRVLALRPDQSADLVLARISTRGCERRVAALLPLLRPGGFLVLAPRRGADATSSRGLGSLVRAAQQSGLQYWQHVVALTPAVAEEPTRLAQSRLDDMRAIRCHHDLLVFRRPAPAEAGVAAAAVAGVAA